MSRSTAPDILRQLEKITASGHRPSEIFTDWLDLAHTALGALPAHLTAAVNRSAFEEIPETAQLYQRLRSRYPKPYAWDHFARAFALLLNASLEWDDVLGIVYQEFALPNKHTGQFFTPYPIASMMAQIAGDFENEVHQRLVAAYEKTHYGIMHRILLGDRADRRIPEFVREMGESLLPLVVEHFDPIRVQDPACGSGVMLLAAAEQTPRWALDWGLVQFYGQDIDATCVKMAQVNMMLHGINGYGLKCALALTPEELQTLPEPWQSKYTQAQSHPDQIPALTAEIRSWSQPALFQ